MLVGATGSGKSTLIDGFANYLFEVNWEDDFRFTLVNLEDEEKRRHKDQVTIFSYLTKVLNLFILENNTFGKRVEVDKDLF